MGSQLGWVVPWGIPVAMWARLVEAARYSAYCPLEKVCRIQVQKFARFEMVVCALATCLLTVSTTVQCKSSQVVSHPGQPPPSPVVFSIL